MTADFSPGWILIVGAFAVPLWRGHWQKAYLLALPILSLGYLLTLPQGEFGHISLFDYSLTTVRIDKLSLVFGIIFHLAAFLSLLYALHVEDNTQHVAGLVYAGSAISAVFAADWITLFIYWELTAVSSVFLIWARRTERSYRAGMRYLVIQVSSGLILLAGIILHIHDTGRPEFDLLELRSLASQLIFISFGIKCAFPLLHNWLQDAYPEATVTGTVFLSAFTTKLAVYTLARGFPGTEMLIWIGAAMTAFPIFYAVIENDLRRVLAYSLNNQLGFMVVGIGVGTEMALNGTAAHAFTHIIYKALLFMSMGAVLFRTGTVNGSDLGGLYKSMPYTTVFCIIGAASISAFPLFSGFISKSLIITAVSNESYVLTWFVLLFASAGVFHHSGIKIPFFAFFAHDSGIRCKEAPWNMLLAMGLAAFLCLGIGIYPDPLYRLLPYPVDYIPYTSTHVITQLQLLLFSALAFAFLKKTGLYPPELKSVNLDSDWLYRRLPVSVWQGLLRPPLRKMSQYNGWALERLAATAITLPKPLAVREMVLLIVFLLLSYLVIDFWYQ
jgi:multicomponent Na+:H+ antiporter subunit D